MAELVRAFAPGAAVEDVVDAGAQRPRRAAVGELGVVARADVEFGDARDLRAVVGQRLAAALVAAGGEEAKARAKPGERGLADKSTAERAVSPDKADAKSPNKTEASVVAKADERPVAATPEAKPKATAERFWLQAGSFANEADAEDLKARLAFAGWEASIQSATLPDKSARYRVRLGPYDNTDALQRMKSDLAARGFDVAVIKF